MNFYVIDKEGLATLCADKQDAETTAKEADLLWPKNAPHKVAQIVQEHPAPVPLTPEQIIDIRRKTTAKTHGEWADTKAFARAIEAAHGISAAPEKGQP
jgi:hypothetical protein